MGTTTSTRLYVLEHEGSVGAWCSLSPYRSGRAAVRGTAELSYFVGVESRGRGYGTALVTHAMAEARRLGKRVLFCIILERNAASVGLMQKCGFELWGRLPDVASIDGRAGESRLLRPETVRPDLIR